MTTSKKIAAFVEPHKTTSGQRFYQALCEELRPATVGYHENPEIVLFNISAPIQEIIKAKLRGQKIVLRVDGLWWDRISPAFLEIFPKPLRHMIQKAANFKALKNTVTDIANFMNENYSGFARIFLANHLIYQTYFSKKAHQRYFAKKSCSVILNGSSFRGDLPLQKSDDGVIRLFIIYSDAPAKGVYETLQFIHWLNEKKNLRAELHVLGFNGKTPKHAPNDMLPMLQHSNYVVTYPPFQGFGAESDQIFSRMHCYLCFSYRDPCPNAVVESMAHGLPVVGIASGGVTEIVGNAGELLTWDDWQDGFFAPHRYEHTVKQIDFEGVLELLMKVLGNLDHYRQNVRQRFADELDVKVCAIKYLHSLQTVAES
jgi:glycosyltransferase involved in cell wall biosynthesis